MPDDNQTERLPGWNASEGDPAYVDPNSPTTEHDYTPGLGGLAEDMAMAEDAYRTNAAETRAYQRRFLEDGGRPSMFTERDAERARWADERARQAAEWAKILHDNPVSEAYRNAHQGVEFSPANLLHIKQEADYAERKAEGLIEKAKNIPVFDLIIHGSLGETLQKRVWNDSEFQKAMNALEPSDTIDQVRRLYLESLARSETAEKSRIALSRNLLDDIRSGRASEVA